MDIRRTMTMNWDELGDLDDDDDVFFDAQRLSSVNPHDLAYSSDEDDEEFDDCSMSFNSSHHVSSAPAVVSQTEFQTNEYDMWMAAPEQSINDRRRRLLQDMGFGSNRGFLGLGSAPSRRIDVVPPTDPVEKIPSPHLVETKSDDEQQQRQQENLISRPLLDRSRSDVAISIGTSKKQREEEMIGSTSKQRLTRTSSGFSLTFAGLSAGGHTSDDNYGTASETESLFTIHNLDNGHKFEGKECNDQGMWNKLRDVQTGEHITMEEFEKNAGHSPEVKEVMKKGIDGKHGSGRQKLTPAANSSFKKSFKKSKKRGASFFKNIKGSMGGSKTEHKEKEKDKDKEKDASITSSPSINSNNPPSTGEQKPSSQWVKARVHGKSYKEFTALHQSQEIKGHDGSIWSMKFTYDGHYLATAGEDKVIHIWEVQEFDVSNQGCGDDSSSAAGTPVHPMASVVGSDGRPPLPEGTPDRKKKGKKKKGIPDYVHVPETVFGLSETPFCTLEGHMEDILDLSWSRSQLLLSSSMDKTVRLWDIETKNCLKLFSHTDFVTCIQFNPADDDYFISGSLDAKVRIWNIPERHVVDWIDLHEMVTAIGYSNDGKVSVVGSHKGICRFYNTVDYKLDFKEQIELKTKKKPQPKKITGFQFSAWNPSELLVTSADSRVRILDGTKIVQKFKGYKNINSQFSADYSPEGKYVISASEDSQVYVWRHEGNRGKSKHTIIKTYEHFPCKEVSVTAPWPGSSRLEPPLVAMHSKRHSKRSTTTLPPTIATAAGGGISPLHDDTGHGKRASSLPPLPKRSSESINEDIDHHHDSSVGPSGESFNSATSSSGRFDDVTGSSPNFQSPSKLEGGGGGHGHKTIQATAWGLVIVTGGLGGEIRVFQNVGLPFKLGRL